MKKIMFEIEKELIALEIKKDSIESDIIVLNKNIY